MLLHHYKFTLVGTQIAQPKTAFGYYFAILRRTRTRLCPLKTGSCTLAHLNIQVSSSGKVSTTTMAVPMARDRVPYLSPPPGKVAFGNDDNLHPTFIALVSVCIALACIAFLLRTCARVKLLRRWAYEDCEFSQIHACPFFAANII